MASVSVFITIATITMSSSATCLHRNQQRRHDSEGARGESESSETAHGDAAHGVPLCSATFLTATTYHGAEGRSCGHRRPAMSPMTEKSWYFWGRNAIGDCRYWLNCSPCVVQKIRKFKELSALNGANAVPYSRTTPSHQWITASHQWIGKYTVHGTTGELLIRLIALKA